MTFLSALDRAPLPKKHYSKQAEIAPKEPCKKKVTFGNSPLKPDSQSFGKKGVPKKVHKDQLYFVPKSDGNPMFGISGVARHTKTGLTELTDSQLKSEADQKLKKQERIKHESFGFF
eukprot:CAMPEP_0202012410 /NCGR_PEP_ID=MMETSP0905-20130828/23278_1 /ASSEMBLY_ACC=CAM_ASM_000554 /TAXON_ID=420261 /ORGANISM="Thalassiosira antarctica, Strain CCMP982" /LENGTH=116 /DNA_ID=CAMNT_0048571653 /DNA_START=1205 /DNA_END=1555 /DNA_ORIENTATION=-